METRSKPVVLVVDDEVTLHAVLQGWGEMSGVEVVSALDTDEGYRLFTNGKKPNIIMMDGNIPGSIPSLELVQRMRKEGFDGHLIAISTEPEVRKRFMAEGPEKGCDMECEKSDLAKALEDILDIHL